jgi:hypothetical protein
MTRQPSSPKGGRLIKPFEAFEAARLRTITVRIAPERVPMMRQGSMTLTFGLPFLAEESWSEVLFSDAIARAIERGELEVRPPPPSSEYALAPDQAPKRKRKGGNRRGLVWDEVILPGLASKVKRDGPFFDEQAAIAAAKACLDADPKKRKLGRDMLVKGTRKWCRPEWFAAKKPAPGN